MSAAYVFLNNSVKPFDDWRVRRALNFADDRHRLVHVLGGATQAAPTCQLDPPSFPGYSRYCPYTADPQPDGSYHDADLATANALIAASGTHGMPIVFWSNDFPAVPALSQYYATVLTGLGYKVTVHQVARSRYFGEVADSRNKAQIGLGAWGVDFPAPANLYTPILSCASFLKATEQNNNLSEYCNKHTDSLAQQAQAAEATDPAAARRLWTQLDHAVTDDAPWVSGVTLVQSTLTSSRMGNYQDNPLLGPLLDQAWVR